MENSEQPATKSDLASVKSDLETVKSDLETVKSDLAALESRMDEKFEIARGEASHHYNDLVERISDGQTELLKAFYSYAQGNNKRVSEIEGNEGAFRSRLATMEDRLLEVEKRLNMPPAA